MSEPLEHPEALFDFEAVESPAEKSSPGQLERVQTTSSDVEEDDDTVETQGALDIGIAIPTPFSEPDVDEEVEAEAKEVNEDVLQHPESAPRKHPNKVSFYQEPEDTARLRGAVLHTMVAEGHRSLSQFVIRAVMKEVQRLEEKYNDGKPFPAVAANEMPQGRPQR